MKTFAEWYMSYGYIILALISIPLGYKGGTALRKTGTYFNKWSITMIIWIIATLVLGGWCSYIAA